MVILSYFKNECTDYAPLKRYFIKRLFSVLLKWVHFRYSIYARHNRRRVIMQQALYRRFAVWLWVYRFDWMIIRLYPCTERRRGYRYHKSVVNLLQNSIIQVLVTLW